MVFKNTTNTILSIGLASILAMMMISTGSAQENEPYIRRVPSMEADQSGPMHPVGLTFSSQSDNFYVLETQTESLSDVIAITPLGNRKSTTRIATTIEDPLNVVFDNLNDRLLAFQPASAQIVEIRENPSGISEQSIIIRHDTSRLGVEDPKGMALDESSGSLFILDTVGPRLVLLQLGPGKNLSGEKTSVIDLSQSGLVAPRGIAFDPTTSHLHVFDLIDQSLYELDQTGRVVAIRDMVPFGLKSPQGMVFAPSGDQTDDPGQVSLFLADSGSIPGRGTGSISSSSSPVRAGAGGVLAKQVATFQEPAASAQESGQILELSLVQPAAAAASSFTSSLVKMTDMSTISPPSPDPSGIAYVPLNNRLIIDDGEVEETVNGITHFQGANVWEMTLAGSLIRTTNISDVPPTQVTMSNEPTGVAWNPNNGHYYFSDDSSGIDVYDLDPGPDGLVGTSDDTWSGFDTSFAGNGDAEGITYDTWNNTIFVADGVNAEVYRYTLSGALISQFDVQAYGVVDPEAVEFNPISGTLFVMSSNRTSPIIVETTTSGALLQTIDISSANITTAAGLAYAPASNGSGIRNFYIVDRGIDNNNDPQVIDGKLFEMSAPASGPTPTPSLTFTPTVTSSGPPVSELKFNPIADAYIQESSPNTNYGSASTVQTDASPVKHFLLKFNVSGINGRKVTGAELRLYNTDSSAGGGDFYSVSNNTWQEGTVTWNNAPVADPTLIYSLGSVSSGNFYNVDLSSLITGDGIYSLRISSTSSNGADYSSKEGAQPPLLTITLMDGETPTVTPTFTASNTATPTKTTTSTVTFTPTSTATSAQTPTYTATSTITLTPTNTATITPTFTATSTPTPSATSAPTFTPTNTATFTPTNTATQTPVSTATSTGLPQPNSIYVSFASNGTVDGLSFTDDDILYFNGQNWSMLFDGSDVGLGSVDVFAISVVDSDTILMSLSSAITVGGLTIAPQDIVRFDATSLGTTTAGTFSMYMDGSDVGLSTTSERIDSLSVLPDGRILISTTGSPSVPGVSGRDEDILAFTPVSLGSNTTGSWAMYFDGSDVGLAESSGEDIDGLDVINGNIYLSTTGDFSASNTSGADEDIFVCVPVSLGDSTACNYSSTLFFDGSLWGLSGNDIDGFYLAATAPAGSPTPIPTNTSTPTNIPTSTPTKTNTPTPTSPFTSTPTATKTATNTPLPGNSPTSTPTPTVTLPPSNTPTFPAVTSFTFTPTDDATVFSSSPNTNAGGDTSLEIDASPLKDFMLKFVVSGINGQAVSNAKLRLYNTNTSPVGGEFHRVGDNGWSESTVTWNTAPTADAQILATLGYVSPGIWYEVDLTSFVTGDGTYSLRITTTSSNGADYSSKEGSFAPELVITVGQ